MHKPPGAIYQSGDDCLFRVWSPLRKKVKLEIEERSEALPLQMDNEGYWHGLVKEVPVGTRYRFILDDDIFRPDPASRDQSEGVHGWSKTRKTDYPWTDDSWQPMPMKEFIIYEIHTGTFTSKGSFEAIIPKLDYLLELGVNAIEIMPVCQFPGGRNWGYDGVYPYAVQDSYGGARGLKKLVDTCHQKGLAVILDVVYNHLGPEGNYLNEYGPYFTDKYHTPWGKALNFDDAHSDHVRSFFIHAALMWLKEFHIDALRLDAVHAIFDNSARHFLREMREEVDRLEKQTGRQYYLIAESDMNDVKLLKSYQKGGYQLDAQWADDFHHSVHTLATGEQKGYYNDFGKVEDLAKAFRQAFVYDGAYSEHRKRSVGTDPKGLPPGKFVVCIQNHDQTGNRMLGERLSQLVSFEMTKLCASTMLIAPFVPLLFMGEEYGESQPFQYFVNHGDPKLIEAVRKGRRREFRSFRWKGEVPDPQAVETFKSSQLRWDYQDHLEKRTLLTYYRHLLKLRKSGTFSAFASTPQTTVREKQKLLVLSFDDAPGEKKLCACLNFDQKSHEISLPHARGDWIKIFASSDTQWLGKEDQRDEVPAGKKMKVLPESALVYMQ